MAQTTRTEYDTMGAVALPADAYFGAQTQRAVENFPVSGRPIARELIHALGLVKLAAATANRDLGKFASGRAPLSPTQIDALLAACRDVAEGKFDQEFPIDVFQTGSGTSSNMNANEVIANRAIELSRGDRFSDTKPIHPNDHVNMGQSTNDMFPTAIHVAAAVAIHQTLLPSLREMHAILSEKAEAWHDALKIGRTHLADATPMTLGQEFSGFARQIELSTQRAERSIGALLELPVGGTAVGTGINTHPAFAARVASFLAGETGLAFAEAVNHFEANAQRDGIVECHAELKTIAVSLFSIANNIRFLGSGPRCGIYEILIPDLQPGSSIMPGKVNPVMSESLMQAATAVIGNDATMGFAGASGGQFQLNIMMPVMADRLLESIRLLASGAGIFTELCVRGLAPNRERCEAAVEQSLSMVTSLAPRIGYERAAALAKEAFASGKTIRELCREKNLLPEAELAKALDPWRMVKPVGE